MVEAAVARVTRGSIAPGVQAGSGRPPWLRQPVVLVRGDGVQAGVTIVGNGTAAVASGATNGSAVGARVAAAATFAVGATVAGRGGVGAAITSVAWADATGGIVATSVAVGRGSVGCGNAVGAHALRLSAVTSSTCCQRLLPVARGISSCSATSG